MSKSNPRLPDFIIGGAPKCGTTSLHFILAQNEAIGIPDEELHYFDADDPITHPDFLQIDADGSLAWMDASSDGQLSLDWYSSRFTPHVDKALVGEDSTTYLFSEVAPNRIKALLPNVKMILLLRDPVKRAYSQYWHLIRSARLSCSFEQALSRHTSIILGSTYTRHIERYFEVFGRENVHVAIFEDFINADQSYVDAVTNFLGAPQMSLQDVTTWFNRSYYPTNLKAQYALNFVGRQFVSRRYANHLGTKDTFREHTRAKMHYRWFKYINPLLLKAEKPPAMAENTKKYLTQHLSARNDGLSDLLGRDLSKVWAGFKG